MKNTFEVLNDPTLQLLKPGSLKGSKILIVMLWTYEMNPDEENKKIMPGYLFESGKMNQPVNEKNKSVNKLCVETAVKNLGGEIKVVINYKGTIDKLLKNDNGKYPYYAVWIMSGIDKCVLPDKNSDQNLLDEFMNVIHIFSSNGGSLVLFGESIHYFFISLYLDKHRFPTEKGIIKTKLRLYDNHLGKKF